MLFLQLKSGEYLTIGEDIAIQVFQETSDRIRVAVTAPRDLSILRGEVRERNGANLSLIHISEPTRHISRSRKPSSA